MAVKNNDSLQDEIWSQIAWVCRFWCELKGFDSRYVYGMIWPENARNHYHCTKSPTQERPVYMKDMAPYEGLESRKRTFGFRNLQTPFFRSSTHKSRKHRSPWKLEKGKHGKLRGQTLEKHVYKHYTNTWTHKLNPPISNKHITNITITHHMNKTLPSHFDHEQKPRRFSVSATVLSGCRCGDGALRQQLQRLANPVGTAAVRDEATLVVKVRSDEKYVEIARWRHVWRGLGYNNKHGPRKKETALNSTDLPSTHGCVKQHTSGEVQMVSWLLN